MLLCEVLSFLCPESSNTQFHWTDLSSSIAKEGEVLLNSIHTCQFSPFIILPSPSLPKPELVFKSKPRCKKIWVKDGQKQALAVSPPTHSLLPPYQPCQSPCFHKIHKATLPGLQNLHQVIIPSFSQDTIGCTCICYIICTSVHNGLQQWLMLPFLNWSC